MKAVIVLLLVSGVFVTLGSSLLDGSPSTSQNFLVGKQPAASNPQPVSRSADAKSQDDLSTQKLRLEIDKLKYDMRSEWTRPSTWLGALSGLTAVIAVIAAAFYSSAKHELAKADARHAQADLREAEAKRQLAESQMRDADSQRRAAEEKLEELEGEFAIKSAAIIKMEEESAKLDIQIAEASGLLAPNPSGRSNEFDVAAPRVKALLKLRRCIVVNESDHPVEIGFNSFNKVTPYGSHGLSPAQIEMRQSTGEVNYLDAIPPKTYVAVQGLPLSGYIRNLTHEVFQVRARRPGKPESVTPTLETHGFMGAILWYDGKSLRITR